SLARSAQDQEAANANSWRGEACHGFQATLSHDVLHHALNLIKPAELVTVMFGTRTLEAVNSFQRSPCCGYAGALIFSDIGAQPRRLAKSPSLWSVAISLFELVAWHQVCSGED